MTRPTERAGCGCGCDSACTAVCQLGAGMEVGFGRVPSLSVQGVSCQSRLVLVSQGFTKMPLKHQDEGAAAA